MIIHKSSNLANFKPASRLRFRGNNNRLSASKCLQQLHFVQNVVVNEEIPISQ